MRDDCHQKIDFDATGDGSSFWPRHGFVLQTGLLDPLTIAQLASWADELLSKTETPGQEIMFYGENLTAKGGRRCIKRVENFCDVHNGFRSLLVDGVIRARASDLLGARTVMFKDKLVVRNPGTAGFPPHQDHFGGWWRYADKLVTAAIAIDEATPDNGCIEFAIDLPRHEHWKCGRPLSADRLAGLIYQPVPMLPGDVIFFHGHTPHRSRPNLSDTPRRVLYATYNCLAEGDMRAVYFAELRKCFPPDCEREHGRFYVYPSHPAKSAESRESRPD